MLFYLLAGHALADYPLQNDSIALCKCRKCTHPAQATVPWYYWLTAHAMVHGAIVGIILRWYGVPEQLAMTVALIEVVVHWFIDLGKCEKLYNIHVDQGLHMICKVIWWLAVTRWFVA